MHIDINCDCGESFGPWTMGADAAVLPHVSSANIACGAHAGDPDVMRQTVRLAQRLGICIGAHPGFPDLQGFGRRVLAMSPAEVENSVIAQIGALAAIARVESATLAHVKPHGALYNHAVVTPEIAHAIARAVAAYDPALILVGLPNSPLVEAGLAAGLRVAREAFADRAYEADGTLRSRRLAGALIEEPERCLAQALSIVRAGYVIAYDGAHVPVAADTICLHGDTPGAAARAAFLRAGLTAAGVTVAPLGQVVTGDREG